MDTLQVHSVSSLYTPPVVYSDPSVSFKQHKAVYDQGFAFNQVQALSGLYDTSINNYTSQYLTNKTLLDSILTVDARENARNTITTPLIFNAFRSKEENKYVYIYESTGLSATNVARPYTVIPVLSATYVNNIYFELEFLNEEFLRIKHNNGKFDFFLNAIEPNKIAFFNYFSDTIALTAERSDMFRYIIDDDGYLQLYKRINGGIKVVSLSGTQLALVDVAKSTLNVTSDTLIQINYTFNKTLLKTNASWISYIRNKINTLTPDDDRSSYDRQGQYLLHTAYNNTTESINLNYLTLNTERSDKGFIKRGSNVYQGPRNIPDANFREYTTLHTGNNQERGNDNISLSYVFYDKDIKVKSGADTYFTAPSSIYPYNKLNINDTTFILNGSLGGPSPLVADKVYLKRKNTTQFNNGRYLCTWLSAATPQSYGVWVDRYYYPDVLTKFRTLSGDNVFGVSFANDVDSSLISLYSENVYREAYFDKKSDLCIEPNCSLMYQRLGEDNYKNIVRATSPYVSGFNSYYSTRNNLIPYNSSEIIYNASNYNRFPVSPINATGQFTVSFDAYVNPDKLYGYQLMGNKTSHGFGVQNDTLITPFIYVRSESSMYIYNTDYNLLSITTFEKEVRDIIPGRPLEDFHVVCKDGYIYRVNAVGNKVKLEILPDIVGYKNYTQTDSHIIFLMDETGSYISVQKNTLSITDRSVATPLGVYEDLPIKNNYAQSIVQYNNNIYKIPGDMVKYDTYNSDIIFFVQAGRVLVRYNLKTNEIIVFAKSNSIITDFNIDENKNIAIAYGDNIALYTSSRKLLYKVAFEPISTLRNNKILNIDFVKGDYSQLNPITSMSLLVLDTENNLKFVLIQPEEGDVNVTPIGTGLTSAFIPTVAISPRYPQTNFNYLATKEIRNSLKFNITLSNYLSAEDIVNKSIVFNLSNIDIGYHTFTYRFDSIQGNITLFVDGVKYTNLTISPGKYRIQNIFADDFFVGSTGFYNGVDLATYLNQPGYYYIKDLQIKNFFLYDRALYDGEIIALNLYDKPVSDIILSLPYGQRNNIEEIERVFKYSGGGSSKSVSINVKNLNIQSESFRNNIRNIILRDAKNILPAGISVNDIVFTDT